MDTGLGGGIACLFLGKSSLGCTFILLKYLFIMYIIKTVQSPRSSSLWTFGLSSICLWATSTHTACVAVPPPPPQKNNYFREQQKYCYCLSSLHLIMNYLFILFLFQLSVTVINCNAYTFFYQFMLVYFLVLCTWHLE